MENTTIKNQAPNVVADIREKGKKDGFYSLMWYKNQVRSLMSSKSQMRADLRNEAKITTNMQIGKLYLFNYDPKLKKTLPVYDTYPLVFPFNYAPGGFRGINLHYLPYGFRIYIIEKMNPYLIRSADNEVKRAKLSWAILNHIAGIGSLNDAVKHYLSPHIRSSFMEINYNDWRVAAALPIEHFVRKS